MPFLKKKIKPMKILFFDLETTGVRYWKNGIHQISGLIDIDGKVAEEFNFNVHPNPKALVEDEALEVAGVTKDDLFRYPLMEDVYAQIIEVLDKYVDRYDKLDKMFLAGYNNASFDNNFFRAFFKQNGDPYFGSWFWAGAIDVMVLALEHLAPVRTEMENFKLVTVARQMGVQVNEAELHDALYDVILTRQLYYKILESRDDPPEPLVEEAQVIDEDIPF